MALIFEPFANTELVLGGAEKLWYFFGMLLALSVLISSVLLGAWNS